MVNWIEVGDRSSEYSEFGSYFLLTDEEGNAVTAYDRPVYRPGAAKLLKSSSTQAAGGTIYTGAWKTWHASFRTKGSLLNLMTC